MKGQSSDRVIFQSDLCEWFWQLEWFWFWNFFHDSFTWFCLRTWFYHQTYLCFRLCERRISQYIQYVNSWGILRQNPWNQEAECLSTLYTLKRYVILVRHAVLAQVVDTSKLSATLSSRATAHCRISKDLLPDVFRGLDKHSRILARKSNRACQHTCPATRKGIEVNRCSTFVHEKKWRSLTKWSGTMNSMKMSWGSGSLLDS